MNSFSHFSKIICGTSKSLIEFLTLEPTNVEKHWSSQKVPPFPKRDLKYIWSMDDGYRRSLKKQCFSMPGKSWEVFLPKPRWWVSHLLEEDAGEAQWALQNDLLESRDLFCDLFVTCDECIHFHGMLTPGCTGTTPKKNRMFSHDQFAGIDGQMTSRDTSYDNRTTNLKNPWKKRTYLQKKLMFKEQSHLIILWCHWNFFTNSTAIFHAKSPLVRPVKHLQSPLWLLDWPASNEFLLDLGPLPPLQQWWLPPPWD